MSQTPPSQHPSEQPAREHQPHYVVMQPPAAVDDEISLLELWYVFARRKWTIITIIVPFVVAAVAYALLATPIYRAEVLLAPAQAEGQSNRLGALVAQFGGLADVAGVTLPSGGDTEVVLATLTSRRFLTGFIVQHNVAQVLFRNRWDQKQQRWIAQEPTLLARIKAALVPRNEQHRSSNELGPHAPTMWEVYDRFRNDVLRIDDGVSAGLINVAVDWEDPEIAAEWANALVDRLNSELRRQAIGESERGIQYLTEQIEQTSLADLRAVLYRIIEEHTKDITLASINEEYALKVIDPAVPPRATQKPKRKLIVALGFILGLITALVVAVVRDFLQRQKTLP